MTVQIRPFHVGSSNQDLVLVKNGDKLSLSVVEQDTGNLILAATKEYVRDSASKSYVTHISRAGYRNNGALYRDSFIPVNSFNYGGHEFRVRDGEFRMTGKHNTAYSYGGKFNMHRANLKKINKLTTEVVNINLNDGLGNLAKRYLKKALEFTAKR